MISGPEWKMINGWSVAATFEGEFSQVTSSYAGKGVLHRCGNDATPELSANRIPAVTSGGLRQHLMLQERNQFLP